MRCLKHDDDVLREISEKYNEEITISRAHSDFMTKKSMDQTEMVARTIQDSAEELRSLQYKITALQNERASYARVVGE